MPPGIIPGVSELPGNVDDVIALVRSGRRLKHVFFWGHRPQRDGSIGTGCLSQWWPSAFTVDSVRFATAEHYMMWRKALLFGDEEAAVRIVAASHPRQAKMLGRRVRGFDEQTWAGERRAIVRDASVAKFGQRPELRDFLVGTGSGSWSRPAPPTGSGASGWRPPTSGRLIRPGGAGSTCWASP